MKQTPNPEPSTSEEPPRRCPNRCVHEEGHSGGCHVDHGEAKWAAVRAQWKSRALSMMSARIGKVGRPSKLSHPETISDIAEHCGFSRATLYRLWQEAHPEPEAESSDEQEGPEVEPSPVEVTRRAKRAIKKYDRAYKAVSLATNPENWKVLGDNSEARTRALAKVGATLAKLNAFVGPFAPQLPPSGRKELLQSAQALVDALRAVDDGEDAASDVVSDHEPAEQAAPTDNEAEADDEWLGEYVGQYEHYFDLEPPKEEAPG
jgi:hypothetical protein